MNFSSVGAAARGDYSLNLYALEERVGAAHPLPVKNQLRKLD